MSPRVSRMIIITPRLDGADGISAVSREAVAACAGVLGAGAVEVWALDGKAPATVTSAVRGAAGRRLRLARWALAAAAHRADNVIVFALHVHLLPLALPLVMRGARLACFIHGVESWRPLRRRERTALGQTATIIANSRWTAEHFRQANPDVARAGVAICPLGVGDAPDPELPPIEGYALIVGRLAADERYKGHDLLVDVWPEVLRTVPTARLVVVGEGDDRGRLERLARDRGVASHIVFTGRVSDAQREGYYRNAVFFVMPSTGEGFGLAYVEAMRAGKACIGAPGAAAEIIEDGVTGLLVDPSSRPCLVDAMVRLFTSRDITAQMGRAAAVAAAKFDARGFASRLASALELVPAAAPC